MMKSRTHDLTAPMAAPPAVDLNREALGSLAGGSAARAATTDDASDISVGLELKFLLLRPSAGWSASTRDKSGLRAQDGAAADPAALQRLAYALVAQTINHTGSQQAVTIHDIEKAGRQEREYWPTHWIVKKANSVQPLTPEDLRLPAGSGGTTSPRPLRPVGQTGIGPGRPSTSSWRLSSAPSRSASTTRAMFTSTLVAWTASP